MLSRALPKKIEQLVDHLRSRDDDPDIGQDLSLVDVASVTEVLIATMQAYFRSLDTTIYTEFRSLSEYITKARSEISHIMPSEENQDKIPRAGKELEAIVRSTEEATNTIMESAETLMSLEMDDPNEYHAQVNDEVMKIFEACSFQDITGQRISKVVETLTYIETRLNSLAETMGVEGSLEGDEELSTEELQERRRREENILHGPQLDGEGVQQDDVDALMNGTLDPDDVVLGKDTAGSAEATEDDIDAILNAGGGSDASEDDVDAIMNGGGADASEDDIDAIMNGGGADASEDDIDAIMNGGGEEASEDDIDAIMNSFEEPAVDADAEPEAPAAEEPAAEAEASAEEAGSDKKDEKKKKKDDDIKLEGDGPVSQDDIDALFD